MITSSASTMYEANSHGSVVKRSFVSMTIIRARGGRRERIRAITEGCRAGEKGIVVEVVESRLETMGIRSRGRSCLSILCVRWI